MSNEIKRCVSSRKTVVNTFRPEINKLSEEIVKDKGNFCERQKVFMEERNTKLFHTQQQLRMTQKTDPNNGQQLYRPQLSHNTIKLAAKNREPANSIHSYLYELSKIEKHE